MEKDRVSLGQQEMALSREQHAVLNVFEAHKLRRDYQPHRKKASSAKASTRSLLNR